MLVLEHRGCCVPGGRVEGVDGKAGRVGKGKEPMTSGGRLNTNVAIVEGRCELA